MASTGTQLTALLIGGTGATGKEVLKELNKCDIISKVVFISRRALELTDQPKVSSNHSILDSCNSFKPLPAFVTQIYYVTNIILGSGKGDRF